VGERERAGEREKFGRGVGGEREGLESRVLVKL
jgi:hypothetical protein